MITGGCQCGQVRYRVEGALGRASICHCRMCQKAFGSWGAPLVSAPVDKLVWTRGRPAAFRSSSVVERGFCAACGTPLFMREEGDPNYELSIGSLDDPELAPPIWQVGVESELSWFRTLHALPRKRTDEDRTPAELQRLKSRQHPDHDTERWPRED
jgi:hypothetical protein